MTDPVAFLAAALDAAQRDAEAARDAHRGVYASVGDAEWYYDPTDGIFTKPHGIQVTPGVPYVDPDVEPHLARHDPASVLRRIAADRKILAVYEEARAEYAADGPAWDHETETGRARTAALELVVRNMAEGWGWTEETT